MAKKAKGEPIKIDPMERITRLLGAIVIKGLKDDEAALVLDGAGFDAREISQMLHVSDNYIHSLKNRRKTKRKSPKS